MTEEKKKLVKEPTEYTVSHKAEEEGWKLHYDAVKHITTLCTGSILILVTFLEKLFTNPSWKWLVSVTFGLLLFSIIGSLYAMMHIASAVRDVTHVAAYSREGGERAILIFTILSYVGFICGIISLIVFAIRNLYPGS